MQGPEPADPDAWVAHTQSNLLRMNELREEVTSFMRRSAFEADGSMEERSIGGPAMEDRLKKRYRTTQSLASAVARQLEGAQHTIFQLRQRISDLNRASGAAKASLSVAEMRMELREKRPAQELLCDPFHEALEHEQQVLSDVVGKFSSHIEAGQNLIVPFEDTKADIHTSRLQLHLSGGPAHMHELLDNLAELEKAAHQFCGECTAMLADTERRTRKAQAHTVRCMKQRIAETVTLKNQIEKEIKQARATIAGGELHLERLRRQLDAQLAMPERALGDDCSNKKLSAHTGVLAELRAKIKAAAYTGTQGRQMGEIFNRFDRDGSGHLDEEEVRRALRRSCRIPPSVVTDAEIASLCQLLDEDRSGTVSIGEIVDFLCADTDVQKLEAQVHAASQALEQLKAAQQHSLHDLRCKIAAWKIDVACSRVTTIKGLKLDTLPTPSRPATASVCSAPTTERSNRVPGTPPSAPLTDRTARSAGVAPGAPPRKPQRPPMKASALENVRSRIKAAAYTGHQGRQLDVVFGRFDKDGSGHLGAEEVRTALRRTLRIPQALISDDDINSLCAMLDVDNSGNISVSEIVAFVGSEPEVSKRTGRRIKGAALEPIRPNAATLPEPLHTDKDTTSEHPMPGGGPPRTAQSA